MRIVFHASSDFLRKTYRVGTRTYLDHFLNEHCIQYSFSIGCPMDNRRAADGSLVSGLGKIKPFYNHGPGLIVPITKKNNGAEPEDLNQAAQSAFDISELA